MWHACKISLLCGFYREIIPFSLTRKPWKHSRVTWGYQSKVWGSKTNQNPCAAHSKMIHQYKYNIFNVAVMELICTGRALRFPCFLPPPAHACNLFWMPSLPSGVQSSETQRKVYQSRDDVILSEKPWQFLLKNWWKRLKPFKTFHKNPKMLKRLSKEETDFVSKPPATCQLVWLFRHLSLMNRIRMLLSDNG